MAVYSPQGAFASSRKYYEYTAYACERAARKGQLDCLKYLRETAKAPWDDWIVYVAHKNNHPECVQYLLDNNCPLPPGWRRWRVARARIRFRIRFRTRIRIITRVLKLPRPCTILKRERETHKHRQFSLHYLSLLPRHITHTHT